MKLTCAVLVLASFSPAFGHHSFAADFDSSKPVSLTGTVTRVAWMNPHATLYVDVKDGNGKITPWEFELASPNALLRLGWTRNSLRPGEVVTIGGFRAKDGSAWANVESVTLSDGRSLIDLRR